MNTRVSALLLVAQQAAAFPMSSAAEAAVQCIPPATTCLPSWEPTWDMMRSTVLYTCNNSGMHDVNHAVKFGTVVYDWSNAKAIWANSHPMSSEELITKQAEAVLAVDAGIPGQNPRVWAYRNTIKALNWYTAVREKLDDPKYASWFIKFKGFSNLPYPGGQGQAVNKSFHVPACDWYNNGTAPRCSGFYHDQEQTPEHPGGGRPYKVDGDCIEQCDCGDTNPCAEYIFDHRGGEVEGRNFTEWFVNEYMVTNETLYHKDPATGKPQVIGLGWLDDSMTSHGPTEEDRNYIADTGASPAEIKSQVDAYRASMLALKEKVLPLGGFWWQLMDTGAMQNFAHFKSPDQCKAALRQSCSKAGTDKWGRMQMYNIASGGKGATEQDFTDYTVEFLLTRGPFAMLGYSWYGCTNGDEAPLRAKEWDEDYGTPDKDGAVCAETGADTGIFTRTYTVPQGRGGVSVATVTWDCAKGHGEINQV